MSSSTPTYPLYANNPFDQERFNEFCASHPGFPREDEAALKELDNKLQHDCMLRGVGPGHFTLAAYNRVWELLVKDHPTWLNGAAVKSPVETPSNGVAATAPQTPTAKQEETVPQPPQVTASGAGPQNGKPVPPAGKPVPPPFPTADQVPPELRDKKRWCAWLAVFDEGKQKWRKPPHSRVTGERVGPVPKNTHHFLTFAEALAGAKRHHLDGVGFVFFEEDGYVGIDFDDIDTRGMDWLPELPTYVETSPSGSGVHIIGKGKLKEALTAKALPGSTKCTVEAYAWDRYFTFTAQSVGEMQPIADIQPGLDKLLAHVGEKSVGSTSGTGPSDDETYTWYKRTARARHKKNLQALRDARQGEGNALLNSATFFAARAFVAGALEETDTEENIKKELLDIVTKEWKSPHPEDGARETIISGWSSGILKPLPLKDTWPDVDAMLEEFEKFFLVKYFGGKARVCQHREVTTTHNGTVRKEFLFEHQSFGEFKIGYIDEIIQVGETAQGKPKFADKGTAWLKNRQKRKYERVVFKPGLEKTPDSVYNLWRGFAFEPKKGDCSLYLNHVRENVCQGNAANYDWLIRWMAWQVRNPDKPGQSAIVVQGEKGVGKNVFAEGFCELWGKHGMIADNERLVTGNFNAHLRDKCCLVADEAFFAKDPRQVNALKSLITGKMLKIEFKGVDVEDIPNLLRLIIIGNDDHIVHATGDERRFFVLECGTDHQKNGNYFAAINNQLADGGYAALLHYLLYEVDVRGFDVRNPPHTEALVRQMPESLPTVEQAWFECLCSGRLPASKMRADGSVELSASDFVTWANKKYKKQITENSLGNLLGDDKRAIRKPMGFKTERNKNGPRFKVVLSLVEARAKWDTLRWKWKWPQLAQGELVEKWELCNYEVKD